MANETVDIPVPSETPVPVTVDTVADGSATQIVKVALGADGLVGDTLQPGQQTKANSLPVTIASDQDAIPVSISSVTPSGVNIIGNDNLTVATVTDYTGSKALHVAVVDSNGNQITSFGGGGGGATANTEYTEGNTDVSITGIAAMMEVASDILEPIQGSVADGLLVNLGANNDVTVSGEVSVVAGASPLNVAFEIGSIDRTHLANIETEVTSADAHLANIEGTATSIDTGIGQVKTSVDAVTTKLPAVGTAGTASADVITVQGRTGMTAVKVDGSAVTQPVSGSVSISGTPTISGTVTANAGTNLNTSALALETGGNLATAATSLATIDDAFLADAASTVGAKMVRLGVDYSNTLIPVNATSTGAIAVVPAQSVATNLKVQAENYQGGTAVGPAAPLSVQAGTGVSFPVTDNSGSLTVDAPVGTPVFTRLSDGSAALVGQKTAANSLPVVIASDQGALTVGSHAVTNAGTFAVQVDGNALTALQLIDDTVVAQGAALGTTKNSMVAGSVTTAAPTYTTGNINPLSLQTDGSLRAAVTNTVTVGSHAVTVASGGIASGAVASGAIASGAIASGAIASGAIASGAAVSGSFADGALVTLGAKADAKSTATDTTAVTIMQVLKQISASVQSPASQAVTNAGVFAVQQTPATSGGLSIARDIDLDNSTLTVVKASAGQLFGWAMTNLHSATVYVKFYNATSGTLGTGTPVMTVAVPAGAMANVEYNNGIAFGTGICVGAGTGVADADNTDPGANLVVANIFYK